ncbi:G-type lectin S-receptor-like serine/threonine-protein kinase B120 isoform X3 [Actinidia eriantha]|uniref:G-type lectin S-receptor-like serine/threonine-protein kinase B120 isoform X3 n=1 Tax=Actinidia eriantha TaxID=165200 RepID=UPI002585ACFF|nr:G-type lectin S-receptor-like serine/threonine-protein kinase B120 isoform X3 [Actinidia eriantha]
MYTEGFFGTGGSASNHYLGIWFKNDKYKKPVWVANRDNPILDDSGILTIRYDGNLVVTDIRLIPIIVNYGLLATSGNTTAKLLDSGNLILVEEDESTVWQSFDYPTDTFLPGIKLGVFDMDTDRIRNQILVSWLSPLVPTSGHFAVGVARINRTVYNVWHTNGMFRQFGFWDGHSFRFFFNSSSDSYNFTFVLTKEEVYLSFDMKRNSNYSWFVLTSTGDINEFTMLDQGITVVNHSLCEGASSNMCLTPTPPICGDDTFSEIRGTILSSMVISGAVRMGPNDCKIMCRINCSCNAYASLREDGTGCQLYYGDKKDLHKIIGKGDGIIYVRGDAHTSSDLERKRRLVLTVIIPVLLPVMLILICVLYFLRWRKNSNESQMLSQFCNYVAAITEGSETKDFELGRRRDHELPLLTFPCIVTATDNFSAANKIGEGGFGPVYEGKLAGHEIAVKRLSKMSGQGSEEFKNEVQLISKLQHRNLVRLLGYCIKQEEKILVYEYLPNKSLDSFIFDPSKQALLDWRKRVQIIEGIAQGLLYLHKYSRLRIIHRDLKTSNILLDSYMNPKISDFGMARIWDENKSQAKTKKVAGTYGYMSPEYTVHGVFSTRSDVFSFGVIMLEIISGRRNTTFFEPNCSLNLLGYAWELWKVGRHMELMDPTTANSCSQSELLLCVRVALLCVQDSAGDRPTMSDVVSMLSNERTNLPVPKQPAFFTPLGVMEVDSPGRDQNHSNDAIFTKHETR